MQNENSNDEQSAGSGFAGVGGQALAADDALSRVAQFRSAQLQFQQFCDAPAENAGIGIRQYQCLLFIQAHPDPKGMPMGELAKMLKIQPATATGLIGRMESKRMLQRLFDTENRRLVRLRLLPDGQELLARLVATDSAIIDDIKAAAMRLTKA